MKTTVGGGAAFCCDRRGARSRSKRPATTDENQKVLAEFPAEDKVIRIESKFSERLPVY
jgi:hypothetical protein